MKRFASHYLLLPDVGYVKQQVVEITDGGAVQRLFALTEEVESVEWMPGVIVLFSTTRIKEFENNEGKPKVDSIEIPSLFQKKLPIISDCSPCCLNSFLVEVQKKGEALFPCLLYPFDFTSMKPVGGTQHKLLR